MGDVPASQSLIYAFDTNGRLDQMVSGCTIHTRLRVYSKFAQRIRSATADDYTYYLNTMANCRTL
jgi:hypothetical protein